MINRPAFTGPDLCALEAHEVVGLLTRGEVLTAELLDASPLSGLPIAIKDLVAVGGVKTTYGTKGLAEKVPATSETLIETLEAMAGFNAGSRISVEKPSGSFLRAAGNPPEKLRIAYSPDPVTP